MSEVKQVLPGLIRRHRHSDSTGSTTSSRSNPMREDMLNRSNTHRARSQFLENHLAKLFEQKMEIFTKVEYTQVDICSLFCYLLKYVFLFTSRKYEFRQGCFAPLVTVKSPCKVFIWSHLFLLAFKKRGYNCTLLSITWRSLPYQSLHLTNNFFYNLLLITKKPW